MSDTDADSPLRFVVLHHIPGQDFDRTDEQHFDWMFQTDDGLRTWASLVCRFDGGDILISCQSLPLHRTAYLDYEGPIVGKQGSENRGSVRRVLSGTFTVVEDLQTRFEAVLSIDEEAKKLLTIKWQPDAEAAWTLSLKTHTAPE